MRRLALLVVALVLTACRVDATVDVTVEPDGSGTVTVELVADADLTSRAPGLADDLRLDDLRAAGWAVDGPIAVDGGGLRVSLSHPFSRVDEADVLLASIGAPAVDLHLDRAVDGDTTTVRLTGTLALGDDLSSFVDADALAALGAAPYAAELAASGGSVGDVVGIALEASLPGSVDTSGTTTGDDVLRWSAPADGSPLQVSATATRHSGGGAWGALATVVLVVLVLWVVASVAFAAYVVRARRQRR